MSSSVNTSSSHTLYKIAALTLAASGIMHLVAAIQGRFAADVLPMPVIMIVYLLLAVQLLRARRWAAYLTFVMMLIGMCGALYATGGHSSAPDWTLHTIAMLDIVTAAMLFIVLWRRSVPAQPVATTP